MRYDKFCKVVLSANKGRFCVLKMGTGVVKHPIWALYDSLNDQITNQGKYKWVSEVFRKKHKDAIDSKDFTKRFDYD